MHDSEKKRKMKKSSIAKKIKTTHLVRNSERNSSKYETFIAIAKREGKTRKFVSVFQHYTFFDNHTKKNIKAFIDEEKTYFDPTRRHEKRTWP